MHIILGNSINHEVQSFDSLCHYMENTFRINGFYLDVILKTNDIVVMQVICDETGRILANVIATIAETKLLPGIGETLTMHGASIQGQLVGDSNNDPTKLLN